MKRLLTFERITRVTIESEHTDGVTAQVVQRWAEWSGGGLSPLDAIAAKQESKWQLISAEPPLAPEPEPPKRKRKAKGA